MGRALTHVVHDVDRDRLGSAAMPERRITGDQLVGRAVSSSPAVSSVELSCIPRYVV